MFRKGRPLLMPLRRLSLLTAIPVSLIAATLAMAAPGPSRPALRLASEIFVERTHEADGALIRELRPASRLTHGDRVVTLLHWSMDGGVGRLHGFTVTDALPAPLAYQASNRDDDEVSVDGGRNWGHLGALTLGTRVATAEDVTHVRWHISSAQARAGSGRIAYSSWVR